MTAHTHGCERPRCHGCDACLRPDPHPGVPGAQGLGWGGRRTQQAGWRLWGRSQPLLLSRVHCLGLQKPRVPAVRTPVQRGSVLGLLLQGLSQLLGPHPENGQASKEAAPGRRPCSSHSGCRSAPGAGCAPLLSIGTVWNRCQEASTHMGQLGKSRPRERPNQGLMGTTQVALVARRETGHGRAGLGVY